MLAATKDHEHVFLAVLSGQGWRVSEAPGLDWEHGVDLRHQVLGLYVGKARRWKTVPMHDLVFEALASLPGDRKGKVFPWRNRFAVYRRLAPLKNQLGVTFTPHMARHEFGGQLRERSAVNRDLLDVCTWTNPKSVERYTYAGGEHAREVLARLEVIEPPSSRGKR